MSIAESIVVAVGLVFFVWMANGAPGTRWMYKQPPQPEVKDPPRKYRKPGPKSGC